MDNYPEDEDRNISASVTGARPLLIETKKKNQNPSCIKDLGYLLRIVCADIGKDLEDR